MSKSKRPTKDPFQSARRQFSQWRRTRRGGARIPIRLWSVAARVARKHGVSKAAVALGLNYADLKKHMDTSSQRRSKKRDGKFVQFPIAVTSSTQCALDLEDATGKRLHMELKDATASEIEVLVRSLWSIGL